MRRFSLKERGNFWDHPVWFAGLRRRLRPVRVRECWSLVPLLVPVVGILLALVLAGWLRSDFAWLRHPGSYPWELWWMAGSGAVATLGGVGDWWFHRVFVSAGPLEHRAHVTAMWCGGLPLFGFMVLASASGRPERWLLPVMISALVVTVLICYDEFVFHRRRCRLLETLLHRMLVFGQASAWLGWVHWCFVERI